MKYNSAGIRALGLRAREISIQIYSFNMRSVTSLYYIYVSAGCVAGWMRARNDILTHTFGVRERYAGNLIKTNRL